MGNQLVTSEIWGMLRYGKIEAWDEENSVVVTWNRSLTLLLWLVTPEGKFQNFSIRTMSSPGGGQKEAWEYLSDYLSGKVESDL